MKGGLQSDRSGSDGELKNLLARVRRIEVTAQRLVNEQLSGRYHSVFKGRGMSFDEVRPYSPGDEVRLIDWNVSARTGEVFIKHFVEERELTVIILADASASMDFGLSSAYYKGLRGAGHVEDTKREMAAQIAAAIALSAQMNNDRVGLLTFSHGVNTFIPPRKGRQHALRVIREVLAMQTTGAPSRLDEALAFLGRVLKRRAAVFMISDFAVEPFEADLRVFSRRHDMHALMVRDPVEEQLMKASILPLQDAETGELSYVATTKPFLRRYREMMELQTGETLQIFRRLRVPFSQFSTARPYDRDLAQHFARLKRIAL